MPTSFLICYPDVPASALVVSTTNAYDVDYPVTNTITGARQGYGALAAATTSTTIAYDLGTGVTRTVDHFILGGCKALKANGVTQATLQGSSNGSVWVNQLGTAAAFQTRTFNGPDAQDVIFTASYNDQYAATLSAYRYFRVVIAGGTHTYPVSKVYLGAAFDMGREPDFYEPEVVAEQDADTWRYPRGHVLMTRAFYPRHRFTVEWDGVTDAKAAEFEQKILGNPAKNPVFLYAATYADPLYDNKLVHCRVVSEDCSVTRQKKDWSTVRAVFIEEV